MFSRLPVLKSPRKIESVSSRESGFLFNNLIFVVMCFGVFWGTLFPVITEAVNGNKISVGPPFFNQINIPIGLALLALTGIGPMLAWRGTSNNKLIQNFTRSGLPLAPGNVSTLFSESTDLIFPRNGKNALFFCRP